MRPGRFTLPQKRGKFVSTFIVFFILSIIFLILFQTPLGSSFGGFLDSTIRPFQRSTYVLYAGESDETERERLQKENQRLHVDLAKQQELEREIKALHDQFNTPSISPEHLIPAQIVGIKGFVPGFSIPSEMILDVGSRQGVRIGQVVVSNDIVVGRITHVSAQASKVDLTTKEGFSLTAKDSHTGALGIIQGQGGGIMLLENVLLSDTLEKDDLIVTKGSMDEQGQGIPPNLVLGKIISVNKKASQLFQSAEVVPLVDVSKLSTVFILDQS